MHIVDPEQTLRSAASNLGGGGFKGVYIIFLISAQKNRLWVIVRTASSRRF